MKIHQTSSRDGERHWKWSISLDARQLELDTVEKVVYHLHPTFKNPVVERSNRSENFELKASGWGTFVVRIEIHYRDGEVEKLRHRLKFDHEKKKVFLSYTESQADPAVIEAVRSEAIHHGWDITSADSISPGEDWSSSLNKEIEESDLFVLIGGDTPSRGLMEELELAQQLGKKALVYDAENLYGVPDREVATNSEELLNEFKAYDFELKGVK